MLDLRFNTFINLCQTLNYTKTAELLHISQPAVTQHIQYLQETYGLKLFEYKGRKLEPTLQGRQLYQHLIMLQATAKNILQEIKDNHLHQIRIVSTFTIAEYIMPDIIRKYILRYPEDHFSMKIKNTTQAFEDLHEGLADFILVEGYFDKSLYNYKLLKHTEMILVAHPDHPLAKMKEATLEQVLQYDLIIREKESRLRGILPMGLSKFNYSYDSFKRVIEVGNMNIMKKLALKQAGICFLHEEVVQEELCHKQLVHIPIQQFDLKRELNMVWLQDIQLDDKIDFWVEAIINSLNRKN